MSTTKQPLKYLWIAAHDDGSMIVQPEDDKSRLTPYDPETDFQPSAFRDIDQEKVVYFKITDGDNTFGVDLETGLFSVNGVHFAQHEQNFIADEKLRLIFFREVKQDVTDGVWQEPYVNKYVLGWQAKDDKGKNHKYTLAVA